MTSARQIEANRRNALGSTGPKTNLGKQRASQNAVRHGLTAETVMVPLEDAEDYQAFEQVVTADYEAETAVERELVLRLASLLWRLRRATSIETGLFQIQLEIPQEPNPTQGTEPNNGCAVTTIVRLGQPAEVWAIEGDSAERAHNDASATSEVQLVVARRFLRLADLDNGVFERLGRYEAALWRQVRQTLFTLEVLRRRKSSRPNAGPYPWSHGKELPAGWRW
jgi:hypothetical protein